MGAERRQFHRVEQPLDVHYRPAGTFSDPWRTAKAINVSAAGVRFRCEERLEQGTEMEIQLALSGRPEPFLIRGVVVWSRLEASGVNESGVEFSDVGVDQRLQLDQLLEFLKQRS
jgi:c-di-GMP-binding flagellar brake protein YcgR